MKPLSALRGIAMAALLAIIPLLPQSASAQGAYEAKLPPEVNTAPALCNYVPCTEVLPGATSFSERKGQPPYVEGYAEENGQRKLVGYVVLSTDVTDTPAYSGKPVITLIGLTPQGNFAGIKILKQHHVQAAAARSLPSSPRPSPSSA